MSVAMQSHPPGRNRVEDLPAVMSIKRRTFGAFNKNLRVGHGMLRIRAPDRRAFHRSACSAGRKSLMEKRSPKARFSDAEFKILSRGNRPKLRAFAKSMIVRSES